MQANPASARMKPLGINEVATELFSGATKGIIRSQKAQQRAFDLVIKFRERDDFGQEI